MAIARSLTECVGGEPQTGRQPIFNRTVTIPIGLDTDGRSKRRGICYIWVELGEGIAKVRSQMGMEEYGGVLQVNIPARCRE